MIDKTFRRPIVWNSAARTDVGVIREVNEDAILVKSEIGLWAVADGMGGHLVGDIASSKIIAALGAVTPQPMLSDYVDAVEDALLDINEKMLEYAQIMFDAGTMGSTIVALLIKERIGACLWVGDSRLYRFRNQQLVQISRDHSQLEEMLEMGLLTKEAAENYPHKNVITRAVGVEESLYVDVTVFTTQIGDIFLLCSDGLYNSISNDEMLDALALRDVEVIVTKLVNQSIANGAPDNVSVVVVQGSAGKINSTTNSTNEVQG